ncbi:hypothetical protein HS1genome_0506 [Sulfodiicoccus acidiphilus]|uniref:HEPN domain-containing protein n=1 Tax=Sulfodiicoccus acidiphilus TaxID=1670455 RepID=A0A348B1R5_9CREN|nr:hypothetical protein HS1genome_0506 [Sulfodiicoccus acidiphilus]GGT94855.1 hypothetical protein GCM10007116_10580 [Sulfodiicoccus acidiphilus]
MEEAEALLSRGDVLQASEKYYKAAEEAIKILSFGNSVKAISTVDYIVDWKL